MVIGDLKPFYEMHYQDASEWVTFEYEGED